MSEVLKINRSWERLISRQPSTICGLGAYCTNSPAVEFLGESFQLFSPFYRIDLWRSLLMANPLVPMRSMLASPKGLSTLLSFSVNDNSQILNEAICRVYHGLLCTSKYLDDQCLAVDRSSGRTQLSWINTGLYHSIAPKLARNVSSPPSKL